MRFGNFISKSVRFDRGFRGLVADFQKQNVLQVVDAAPLVQGITCLRVRALDMRPSLARSRQHKFPAAFFKAAAVAFPLFRRDGVHHGANSSWL